MSEVSVQEALDRILARVPLMEVEQVPLTACLGRVLAEEIRSRREHPPWDNSAMDGFAVRWEDVARATPAQPVHLRIVGEVRAGMLPDRPVGPGEAIQIMTGAPIPEGADTVVRVEDAEIQGEEVSILKVEGPGAHIRKRGEDLTVGALVIPAGTRCRPAEIGMLAGTGQVWVRVRQRPRVAVLATGDEIVDPGEPLGPHQILNTNGYALVAQVAQAGGMPVQIPMARDEASDVRERIRQALEADLVVVAGGISMGRYDFVRSVLEEWGCEMVFWRVRIRPGHPTAFGVLHRNGRPRLLFGLPGNPVSSMVTFYQFVWPAIRKALGMREVTLPRVEALLESPVKVKPGRTHYLRGILRWEEGMYRIRLTGDQGSGILRSMVEANAFIVIPESGGEMAPGSRVSVQILPGGGDGGT